MSKWIDDNHQFYVFQVLSDEIQWEDLNVSSMSVGFFLYHNVACVVASLTRIVYRSVQVFVDKSNSKAKGNPQHQPHSIRPFYFPKAAKLATTASLRL